MGKLYKKYTKASVKKIQSDAIAGKALKYQVDILLKPQYIRPVTHDLLALLTRNKYLKEHVDYVKVNMSCQDRRAAGQTSARIAAVAHAA